MCVVVRKGQIPRRQQCFDGNRLLGKLAQVRSCGPFLEHLGDTLPSKRWIVDRATLKQARVEDLQYVHSPDHIDLLNIYFANRAPTHTSNSPYEQMLTHDRSHRDAGQTPDPASEGHCDRDGIFQEILRQKPVLRDGPIYRDSRLLLRRCEGRGIAGSHKERRFRITHHVWPYVPSLIS